MAKKLLGLEAKEYEHQFDNYALQKVKSIPVLPKVLNTVMTWTKIKWDIVALCGSNFHVTKDACSDLFELAHEVAMVLDFNKLPTFYLLHDPYINAYTTGFDNDSYVVMTSGAVDAFSDKEQAFVLGHELGHIKSGHVLYHVTGAYLASLLSNVPGAAMLQAPLNYWQRMSEFTADRAGLLACQDLDAALSVIMKTSGLPKAYYESVSTEGFLKQVKEFDQEFSGYADQIIRGVTIMQQDHPWSILRASELVKWVEAGGYDMVINAHKTKLCPTCHHEVPVDYTRCPYCGYQWLDEKQ